MTSEEPHTPQQRRLRGLEECQKCGAKTRRGTPCAGPVVQGKRRCRMHGGMSTGPRTPEGLRRVTLCNIKHGRKSKWFRAALRAAGVAATGIEADLIAAELHLQELRRESSNSGDAATVLGTTATAAS